MIADTTIFIFLAAGSFLVLILGSILLNVFFKGVQDPRLERYMKMVAFGLFLVIGFSIVPIFIKIFADTVPKVTQSREMADFIVNHAWYIVFFFWTGFIIGLAVAWPELKKAGFFKSRQD